MKFGPEDVRRLSAMFDQAVQLSPQDREAWLADLPQDACALQEPLRRMLLRHDQDGSGAVLEQGAPADLSLAPNVPGDMVGPYRLVELIGRGGMGEVWRAEQSDGRLRRTVALKLPRLALPGPMLVAHFARERDILAALDHPAIAKLFDAGISQRGQPFLAMQYVAGRPITAHCDGAGMGVAARVALLIELLGAVQHAHSALVVHRDLKPGNVFVTDQGRIVLLDFGIGKLLSDPLVPPGSAPGELTQLMGLALTPDYASPEQIAGKPAATASDIYSVGVLAYELLCGERPYRLKRPTRAALEEAILEQEIVPPSERVQPEAARLRGASRGELARALRGDLNAIVLKAIARDPARRYATAQAFAEDLERWLRKEPVRAQPDRWTYRTGRLLVRRWRPIAVAAVAAGGILAAAAVARLEAVEAQSQRAQAQDEARKARAVVAFLQDLFTSNSVRQPDPSAARRRTAEQLLDDGARQIAQGLSDAPEARLELLQTIATMYWDLRLPDKAVELQSLRARQTQALHGPEDRRTLAAWLDVAQSAYNGDLNDAGDAAMAHVMPQVPRLEGSIAAADRRAAADIIYTQLQSMFRRDVSGALPVADRLSSLLLQMPEYGAPAQAEHWLAVEHFLGVTYFQNLRLAAAEAHFAASDRLREALGPAYDRQHATHLAWHAMLLDLTGQHQRAQGLFERANAMEREADAGARRITAWVLNTWVQSKLDAGELRQALTLAETGAPAGGHSAEALSRAPAALLAQSRALAQLGKGKEALERAERARALAAQWTTNQWLPGDVERASALIAAGRLGEADAALQSSEAALKDMNEIGGLRSRNHHFALIRLRMAQHNVPGARAALERARAVLDPPGAGERERLAVDTLEAQVEVAERRPAQARARLHSALARIASSPCAAYAAGWRARARELLAQIDDRQ